MIVGSHIIFGAACYKATMMLAGEPFSLPLTGVAMVGSLLPDIDHPRSFIGRRLKIISVPLSAVIGHRGLTHSAIAVLLFSLVLFNFFGSLAGVVTALCIGYLSHILGDFMTKGGVPLLWPIKHKFSMPFAMRTGGTAEMAVSAVLLLWLVSDILFSAP